MWTDANGVAVYLMRQYDANGNFNGYLHFDSADAMSWHYTWSKVLPSMPLLFAAAAGNGPGLMAAPAAAMHLPSRAAARAAIANIPSGPKAAAARAASAPIKGLPASTAESVTDKLRRYLLDPNPPVGGDKATWFRKALGFTQDNLDDLATQIKFDPVKAVATELTQHGQKYEQIIEIVGANGKRIPTLFVWIENNDGIIRLVTSTLGVN